MDGGQADSSWDSGMTKAVSPVHTVNDPSDRDAYWSVEMTIPFTNLISDTRQTVAKPNDGDIWRVVLARPEWKFRVEGGKYVQLNESESFADWWSWAPHGALNLHLPDRWGYLQFSTATPGSAHFSGSDRVKQEIALFAVFNAIRVYHAKFGIYTDDISLLILPEYLSTETCFLTPTIGLKVGLDELDFVVTVKLAGGGQAGYIRSDRFVWYGSMGDGVRGV